MGKDRARNELAEEGVADEDRVYVDAGIEGVAIAVGNVLVLIAEDPGARARFVEELKSCLKIKRKIKLSSVGDVDGDGLNRREKPRGGCAKQFEAVLTAKIQLETEGIDATAVDGFVAGLAEAGREFIWICIAGDIGGLVNYFDGEDVERVFQRDAGPIVDRVAIAKTEHAELAVARDPDQVRISQRVAAPDAEFGVALAARCGRERDGSEEHGGEHE
jgi:hypothetical protein